MLTSVPALEKESLLSLLGVSPDMHVKDLQHCLAQGNLLEVTGQDRVKWIMESQKLREWLGFSRARVLLVNGDEDVGDADFAATTFLSAKLVESLTEIEPIITLHFFCSAHAKKKYSIPDDARGLLSSLVGQLDLMSPGSSQAFLSHVDIARLKENDLEILCKVFRGLIEQLPPTILLFMMIDSVTLYERTQRRQNFLKAIKEMMEAMKDSQNIVFKLLLTCQGRSMFLKRLIDGPDILTAPPDIDGDRQG